MSLLSQVSAVTTMYAVLTGPVCLLKTGVTGRFTAQTAATSPSPAVGLRRCRLHYNDLYLASGARTSVILSQISLPAGRICSMNNGGCSHVCVDEAWGALCSCPAGYELSPNGAVCEGV